MPHSNFKGRSPIFSSGVGKCSCSQTLDFASERDMAMKLRPQGRCATPGMHLKFCSNPPVCFDKMGVPKKAFFDERTTAQ